MAAAAPSATGQADLPPLVVKHRGPLLFAVMAAMVMQMLDTTIANVALPHMGSANGASPSQSLSRIRPAASASLSGDLC